MAEPEMDESRRQWHRRFAVDANNRAWALSEQETLSADERVELLLAGHAAAYHWYAIGTPSQRAHADLLLGRVHAVCGHPASALEFATRAFAGIAAGKAQLWELAFAHAVLADAAAAAGDATTHAAHYADASRIGGELDAEDKGIFTRTFSRIPPPRT